MSKSLMMEIDFGSPPCSPHTPNSISGRTARARSMAQWKLADGDGIERLEGILVGTYDATVDVET